MNYVRLIYTFFSSVSTDQNRQNHLVGGEKLREEKEEEKVREKMVFDWRGEGERKWWDSGLFFPKLPFWRK